MIGQTINQYKILERIGAGGMGVVYKAEDTRLGRTVALKFLPPAALDSEEDRTRFLIEAQSAAALDHPNICTIHEIGDVGQHQFIVMAYVAGPSLKERLKDGAIEPAEAIDIAAQIASGLSQAHEKGIIHRDIKPANILLAEGGLVKVCDFGIAKSSISKKVTRTGSTIGTAAYMSPEQARSELVDRRTDIWSLGVILYEMLAGKPPFVADHEAVVIYAILNDDYPRLEGKRLGLPAALYDIVKKSLAHNLADRYASMEEMRRDLKIVALQIRAPSATTDAYPIVQISNLPPTKPVAAPIPDSVTTIIAVPKPAVKKQPAVKPATEGKKNSSPVLYIVIGALTVVAILAVFWFNRQPKVEAPPPEESIAVIPPVIAPPKAAPDAEITTTITTPPPELKLPVIAVLYLENSGKRPDDDYLAAGMTQELIDALSGIKNAKVLSRYDVLPLRGMTLSAVDIVKRLGAEYLLESAIQRDKREIRLTAHLHRVSQGDLRTWRFVCPVTDVFCMRSEIADSVAAGLGIAISPEENRTIAKDKTSNADAYDQFLKGRYDFERRTEDGNELAEKGFRRAISLDGGFTAAQIGLARTLVQQIDWGWDDDKTLIAEAVGLLQKAAQPDTSSAEYHSGVGVLSSLRNNISGAIRAHRRSVQIAPQDPDTHYLLGVQLATMTQSEEAGKEFRRAIELKPDYVDAHLWLARVATFTGKPGDADKSIATALDVSPKQARVRVAAGLNSFYKGDFAAADLQLQNAIALRPKAYRQRGTAGIIALFQRRVPEAISLLKDACVKVQDWRLCLRLGQAYQLSGKSSQADKALNDALAEATKELVAHPGDLETEFGQFYIRCLQGQVKDPEADILRLGTNTQKTLDPSVRYYYLAAIDAHFGKIDRAIESLEIVLKLNVYAPAYIGADPMFVNLKKDSRFQKLVGASPSS